MARNVEALVRNFLKTSGDALYLVPGERIFLIRGTQKVVVGREEVSDDSFRAVAAELAPGTPVESLADQRLRVPYRLDETSDPVEIVFGRSGGAFALMITRARPGEPSSAPAAAPVPVEVPTRPAAPATPEPRSGAYRVAVTPDALDVPESLASSSRDAAEITYTPFTGKKLGVGSLRARADRPVDELLIKALERGASDLLLATGSRPGFRVEGEMVAGDQAPLPAEEVERLLNHLHSERTRKELAERHDVETSYEIPGAARFRVTMFRDRNGIGASFRVIPAGIPQATDLGLGSGVVELVSLPRGLVIVAGQKGSGRSTTLAVLIDQRNEHVGGHIVTLEDPIEFVHANRAGFITQREVGASMRSVADGLRSLRREDADVVLVGSLRDPESVLLALELAESGVLVLAALPTSTVPATVDRVVELVPPDRQSLARTMLADSLRGVVVQTLCRRRGGGRVAAREVLLPNGGIADAIRDGRTSTLPGLIESARGQGMCLLNDSLLDLVRLGYVEAAEAWRRAVDRTGLLSLFNMNGIPFDEEAARGS